MEPILTEQEKLEKVIKGLGRVSNDIVDGYITEPDMACNAINDAIDLLKKQEPRTMTWREVIGAALECKPVYIEVKDGEDKEPTDDRWAMVTQYRDSITNGMIRAMSSYVTSEILYAEDYGKRWRCWTSHPADTQREATSWNERSVQ